MSRLSRVASPRCTLLAFALVAAACVTFGAIAQANLSETPVGASAPAVFVGPAAVPVRTVDNCPQEEDANA